MTPIKRTELLQALESVEPALVTQNNKLAVEQAECYCFKNGYVTTFDGEVLYKIKTNLPEDLIGAVHGKPLLEALRKLEVDNVEVEVRDKEFVISGKRDEIGVRLDPIISLPIEKVEKPTTWKPIPSDFSEGLEMVCECAGRDEQAFLLVCVHATDKFIECTDGFTFCRYRVKTNLESPSLFRAKYAKAAASRGPTRIAETENWLHLKNGMGLRIAIRRFDPAQFNGEKMERFNEVVKERGKPCPFPKSLVSASRLAEIFSGENADNNYVTVNLKDGFVKIVAQGVSGRALHKSKVNYHGPSMQFTVGPVLLANIIDKYNDIEVRENRLLVHAQKWYFSTNTNPTEG